MMNTQWKLVPVEPSESILDAMTTERKKGNGVLQMWFEAMAAAPAPSNAEASEASAAIATLQHLGYAYCGGEHWKPPIGKKPDFDLIDTLRAERDDLQLRLNTADQRIDELTQSKDEQVALMPVERSYDVRAKQILAFNTCKQGGGDLDDALGAAYKAALRYTPHPGEQRAPGSVVRLVDPERERLMEIVERYPNGDPLEYDAAVRKLQQ